MPAEDIQIEQIRFELTWRIRHEVMYPHLPFDAIKLPAEPDGIHFGLYAADWLSSVVSLFNDGDDYQFRKFATLEKHQRKGYGSLLLAYVIAFVRQEGGKESGAMRVHLQLAFMKRLAFNQKKYTFLNRGLILSLWSYIWSLHLMHRL